MIAYLQGQVLRKLNRQIILDTGKIGYLVNVPTPLLEEIEENDNLELFIHTNVREDDLSLYGVKTVEEYYFLKDLISISGIGPRLAMDILAVPIESMKGAILNEDTNAISKIPGIGKKTAERIVLELKGKVGTGEREYKGLGKDVDEDAVEALVSLGYQKGHIQKVISKMPEDIKGTEEIIKHFLTNA
ncbi:MAG: Holliday junction branch migration protein RuvA [Patescibacteria group bacterium]|nr:Holliday junction branch migration protein RuvA [Patescibacteria group bacterium]